MNSAAEKRVEGYMTIVALCPSYSSASGRYFLPTIGVSKTVRASLSNHLFEIN